MKTNFIIVGVGVGVEDGARVMFCHAFLKYFIVLRKFSFKYNLIHSLSKNYQNNST